MIYLLDTDHNSALQRGGEGSIVLERRLRALGGDDFGTSIVSYEEQCRGWTDYIHRATAIEARIDGYARLKAACVSTVASQFGTMAQRRMPSL